jgi:trans-aconitate methyltransferase
MEEEHRPLWRHFIQTIPETDLSDCQVVDFGCNRGGFLHLLHELKPFRHALGIDIAQESIAACRGAECRWVSADRLRNRGASIRVARLLDHAFVTRLSTHCPISQPMHPTCIGLSDEGASTIP